MFKEKACEFRFSYMFLFKTPELEFFDQFGKQEDDFADYCRGPLIIANYLLSKYVECIF